MKTNTCARLLWILAAVALALGTPWTHSAAANDAGDPAPAKSSIPWSQIGAKAGADYQGDGLGVSAVGEGARLRCVFQRLEGEATSEGLWLTSTVTNTVNERFRVMATEVGRVTPCAPGPPNKTSNIQLKNAGTVEVTDKLVRFLRPGVIEEYSVSMDGVRQDFVVLEKPGGASVPASRLARSLAPPTDELRVELAVTGARVEQSAYGAQLVLENSGRKIAYSRLRVTDATGKELQARMEVASGILPDVEGVHPAARILGADFFTASLQDTPESAGLEAPALRQARMPAATKTLTVLVNDADAVYPVRIDPTFSDANWISMGGIPGANGLVYAAVVDGSGNLYIGGEFTLVGDVLANHVAKWNGSSWSALGSGVTGGSIFGNPTSVRALAVLGSNLYAGGSFTTAGGSPAIFIAKWDGSSWSALGSGMNGFVVALAVSGSDVYTGGFFTTAGGSDANHVAKWNGNSWSALGSGVDGGVNGPQVYALAVSGSDVYVGGYFTTAGGSPATNIAKWNGSSWTALGSGMGGPSGLYPSVHALAVSGSDLYAGGYFLTAGGSAANSIAKWNGSSWSALGSGLEGDVYALAVSGSDLYAGGNFYTAGGSAANGFAKWNGSSWSALGSGMDNRVRALAVSGSDVYAGGEFTTAGGSAASYIAKWNGSSWSALASRSAMNSYVSALAVSGSDLYAGGYFTTAGGSAANYIAKWDGNSWTALGSGIDNEVHALAVSGSDLYAGGVFTTAGGSAANHVAKWNGNSWTPLGSGMGGDYPYVYALAVSGSDVYVGGRFTTAGGSAANGIAKWNGSSWSALGSGMGGPDYPYVSALAVSGSNVYVGGVFTNAGGIAANHIAKWNGSSWSALGSGMDNAGYVHALAVSGGDVYAGGAFTNAGGSAANRIAKWNGSSWTALDSGMNEFGYVSALAVSGGDVYAGGQFTTAGGSAANYIAKWNGSSWSALGSGMMGGGQFGTYVSALAVSGSDLYAGGNFTTAGGKVSAYVAKAYLVAPPGGVADSIVASSSGTANVQFYGNPGHQFDVQRTTSLTPPVSWTTVTTSPLSPAADGAFTFVDPNAPNGTAYYRAVER